MHAAVSAGEVCFGVVGGYEDMWSHIMSSLCFDELKQCINVAGPQETVVSSNFYSSYELALAPHFAAVATSEKMKKLKP